LNPKRDSRRRKEDVKRTARAAARSTTGGISGAGAGHDDRIDELETVLPIVGGKIVFDAGARR